ncbi:MAG: GNAT family N-acetyltransferase [Solobacterium sp.]|nr:GNAT family N-acetyltransferase [Solobacterium sp.]
MSVLLEPWPYPGESELRELYSAVDQKYCLVQLPVPLPAAETRKYLAMIHAGGNEERSLLTRAVIVDGILAGKIELSGTGEDTELDIVLRKDMTGKGYGSEALRLLVDEIRNNALYPCITAYVHKENIHARRMFAKAGMRQIRPFRADILIPSGGQYRLKETEGYEYLLLLE